MRDKVLKGFFYTSRGSSLPKKAVPLTVASIRKWSKQVDHPEVAGLRPELQQHLDMVKVLLAEIDRLEGAP